MIDRATQRGVRAARDRGRPYPRGGGGGGVMRECPLCLWRRAGPEEVGPAARGMKERVGGRKDAAAGPGRWLAGPLESLGEDDERHSVSSTCGGLCRVGSRESTWTLVKIVKKFNAREPIID
jgi:hypothetical protein